ncbi:MAG: ComF family protein [Candidatus Anammoxibacter sp.]
MSFIDYINTAIDFVYPRHCFSCDNEIENETERFVCDECKSQIKISSENRCLKCGLAIGLYTTNRVSGCLSCKNMEFRFDAVHCVTAYNGVIRALIHRFKYDRKEVLSVSFGNNMIEWSNSCSVMSNVDLIVPVPLFWQKRIKRGFNQSLLIAKSLAKHNSIPISINNLKRIRNTETQANLTRNQRLKNVKDAFKVKKPAKFSGKKILLVDDVMTTGVTASECARILKAIGTQKVDVLVLARVDTKQD